MDAPDHDHRPRSALTRSSRVQALLTELTLDEKASLTAGADMWHGHAVPRLDIPAMKVSDGPAGVRGERWVGTTSACTPCGTALGATWNPELLREVGEVLGDEAISKGVDIVLAPTVNLHRNPLAGRNFECFSEDPHLSAVAATAVIDGIQGRGVGACVKHLVANDSEYERHSISSEVSERVLRELYLVPFEAAVLDGRVVAVMSAYNRLNGTYCASHEWLLREVLKGEWGFDGIVVSDWWGTKGDDAAEGGLDLEMPGPPIHLGPRVAERVRMGELPPELLDEAVGRVLGVADRLGVLDRSTRAPERSDDLSAHRDVLLRAATEAVVLLRNDPVDGTPVLPLDATALGRVALLGPSADVPAALGGGSAAVNPHHVTTVRDGLAARLGGSVEIVHEAGVAGSRTVPSVDQRRVHEPGAPAQPGLRVDYHAGRNLEGDPVHIETVASPRLVWLGDPAPGVAGGDFSVRVSGTFTAEQSGPQTFSLVTGGEGGRVLIDGTTVLDNFGSAERGSTFFGLGSTEITTQVEMAAGQQVELVAEMSSFDGLPAAALLLGHRAPLPGDAFERAVAAARTSDVAVVVVGLDQDSETEGEDRRTLALPGRQGELVRAVVDANPRTVVLVNAGSVVDLDPTDGAPALAQTWYLGQEAGDAVAALLVGDIAPSGRLPMTYGHRLEHWPSWNNYPGEHGRVLYGEELFMGYRGFDEGDRTPRFPFGHGLGYTTFEWTAAAVDRDELSIGGVHPDRARTAALVRVELTNVGDTAGSEVVQCYVHDGSGHLRRPDQELRRFAKVHLEPGEAATVELILSERDFAAWDPDRGEWFVAPGDYELRLGASSRDLRALLEVEIVDQEA